LFLAVKLAPLKRQKRYADWIRSKNNPSKKGEKPLKTQRYKQLFYDEENQDPTQFVAKPYVPSHLLLQISGD